jgi:curli biogenesis system outer membrane secretion channel CsgG
MAIARKCGLTSLAVATLLLGVVAACASSATQDVATERDAVLRQEARWLTAITAGDRPTIEAILSPDFKHITSEGKLLDRAQEIGSIVKVSFTMNPTEQFVDVVGDTAVIHGVNTITETGNVLARERFTDVFVKQNGNWLALSAQETTM